MTAVCRKKLRPSQQRSKRCQKHLNLQLKSPYSRVAVFHRWGFARDSYNPFILILAGQSLIRTKLALNVNHPLRQRLAVKYFMRGLEKDEIKDYCLALLKKAGCHEEIFTPQAFEAIYATTNGLPRLINNLVTACLISAASSKNTLIDQEIVYQAQKELEI